MLTTRELDVLRLLAEAAFDENGVVSLLNAFLKRVADADGILHVSFDVDFLDPAIAPGVGTTVPGGATFREAHLIMEILHDSSLVTSLDLVELNPFLDEPTAALPLLMVDLVASLMGLCVLDRPTQSFSHTPKMGLRQMKTGSSFHSTWPFGSLTRPSGSARCASGSSAVGFGIVTW